MKRNDHDFATVLSLVVTCCILHNICEMRGEIYDVEEGDQDIPPLGIARQRQGLVATDAKAAILKDIPLPNDKVT